MEQAALKELVDRGIALARKGKHLKAVYAFREALALSPRSGIVCYNLALEYLALEQPEKALEYLEAGLEEEPSQADYWCEKGVALFRMGNPVEADQAYRKALALGGESSRLHNNIGVLHFVGGRLAEAEEAFRLAVTLNPRDRDAWFNLGDTLEERGDSRGAREARKEYEALFQGGGL